MLTCLKFQHLFWGGLLLLLLLIGLLAISQQQDFDQTVSTVKTQLVIEAEQTLTAQAP